MGVLKESGANKEQIAQGRQRYLDHTDQLMMVVIDFNDGPSEEPDPPHSHPHEQISYVVEGYLEIHIGNEVTQIGPGDIYTVPPDVEHTIRLLSRKVRLVDTFTPLREDFLK